MTKGRILCTEDDPDSREMLSMFLTTCGYEVVCPFDSADALNLIRGQGFDLVFLDNWMPGLNGVDLTRLIREFNKETPILFYSGAASESDRREALQAGAQSYLTKPEGLEELVSEIDRLITKQKSATA